MGIGSKLMSVLKGKLRFILEYMQKKFIYYFMTFADNRAIDFFKKQGFSEEILLPPVIWKKCIKEYIGGTLMECKIHKTFPYQHSK